VNLAPMFISAVSAHVLMPVSGPAVCRQGL